MVAVYAILLFLLMIIPHEFGHLVVAKLVGVQVNEFAVGMGPTLFKGGKGETTYSLRLFPIGGFCAMEGENEESDNPRAFNNKPPLSKIAVLLAGAFMNVVTACILMIIVAFYVGVPSNTLESVKAGSPAEVAGIQAMDEVIAIDGKSTETWQDVLSGIEASGDTVAITVDRRGEEKTFTVEPENAEGRRIIGIETHLERSAGSAITVGIRGTYSMGVAMIDSFKALVTGGASLNDVAGPVGMVSMVGQAGDLGFAYVATLIALVSLNLAFINLLPLPALDGGRIIFVIIRQITGKMISDKTEGIVHMIGFALLIGLAIMVTINDVGRFF